jgi:hypothetical protein
MWFLIIASLLSLLLVFLSRKHRPFVEWLVISCSAAIAALIAALLYPPLSFVFVVTLFFVFVLLCFLVFAAMLIFKSIDVKKKAKVKSSSNGFGISATQIFIGTKKPKFASALQMRKRMWKMALCHSLSTRTKKLWTSRTICLFSWFTRLII